MKKDFFLKTITDIIIVPIFEIFDFIISKNKYYWGFSVHHIKSNQFIENQRAIFEEIKNDKNIKKIIFTRNNNKFELGKTKNTVFVKTNSLKGLFLLAKCRVVFVSHSISMDYSFRFGDKLFSILKLNLKKRYIVNVWHGIPLKKLLALTSCAVRNRTDRVKFNKKERCYYKGLIASSDIDSYAMSTMFYPIKYENIWLTGLPRNDYLIRKFKLLPKHIQSSIQMIKKAKKKKRLILYAPTYRQTSAIQNSFYYQFTKNEIDCLKKVLIENNAILGFRMHYFRNDKNLFNMEDFIDNQNIINLGHEKFPEIGPLIRESDLIISDYSSVYIDSLYVNKPVIGFMYDHKHYNEQEDGLLYDLSIVFPGPIAFSFKSLLVKINQELNNNNQTKSDKYIIAKKVFFNYSDDKNSERVIEKIIKLIEI